MIDQKGRKRNSAENICYLGKNYISLNVKLQIKAENSPRRIKQERKKQVVKLVLVFK